ncbi:MAG: diguanylate cyclase, partial [Sulfuritalea sp.]|nr:diguanylate cyclase [Sulfuritalea sp.]
APVSFLGKNYGFRVYFRQALAQGESAYVAKGVTSRIPGYYLSHAVRLEGKVLGVVVSKISMDMIEARLGWRNGHNGHLLTSAIIADPRGVVLMPQNQRVNDTHGHLAGDAVLRGVGEIFTRHVRGGDFPMRFGGEELMLVLTPCPDEASALVLTERIRQAVAEASFPHADETVRVTLSAGIAMHQAGENIDRLIERADEKLYEAKQSGRNRVCA